MSILNSKSVYLKDYHNGDTRKSTLLQLMSLIHQKPNKSKGLAEPITYAIMYSFSTGMGRISI